MKCQLCPGLGKDAWATVKITYGLYSAYAAGRPHLVLYLCPDCATDLWVGNGCVPLKNLVTAGLAHFVIEGIDA